MFLNSQNINVFINDIIGTKTISSSILYQELSENDLKKVIETLEIPENTDINTEKLENYYEHMQDAMHNRNIHKGARLIPNKGRYKATLLMKTLLENTKKEIAMVVGQLNGAISGQQLYIEALKGCIERNIRIRITFLDKPNEESKAYQLLQNYQQKGGDVVFYRANENINKELFKFFNNGDKITHFSVFDSNHCRIETNPNDYQGYGIFHNPDMAKELLSFYNEIITNKEKELVEVIA